MKPSQGANAIVPSPFSGDPLHELIFSFNQLLEIDQRDEAIVAEYREFLIRGGQSFAQKFRERAQSFPTTVAVYNQYPTDRLILDTFIQQQADHLTALLSVRTSAQMAERVEQLGRTHYRQGVRAGWILASYRLFQDHLSSIVHRAFSVNSGIKAQLHSAIGKLLHRDLALLLDGYWKSSREALSIERDKIVSMETQMSSLLANVPQLLWSVDVRNNEPLYVSPSAKNICGCDISMPIPCLDWTVLEDREAVNRSWQRALNGFSAEVESKIVDPAGKARWFRRTFNPYRDGSGRVVRIDGVQEDITEWRVTVDRLQTMATTDLLTGLPNRTLFIERLKEGLALVRREAARHIALFIIDLDNFKDINDGLGQPAGDYVLSIVGQRLQGCLRDSDAVARLGGDEFAALCMIDEIDALNKIADKITQCFATPVRYQDDELTLSASIGIATYRGHAENVDQLMKCADTAMYVSKSKKLPYAFYNESDHLTASNRLKLSADLRRAIEKNELELFYQPKLDLVRNQVIGVEALVRWRHPERGLVGPNEFISIAERTGLIHPMTDWVLREALGQARRWAQAGLSLRVAVNISAQVFQGQLLLSQVMSAIEDSGAPQDSLELEITENELMINLAHVRSVLNGLKAMDIRVSIDDFGTGYSSLAYLKQLPLDALKIDRSFVFEVENDPDNLSIVRSVVDLAHNLRLGVIAEGVETERSVALLKEIGCDVAQGYYISEPKPARELEPWLMSHR